MVTVVVDVDDDDGENIGNSEHSPYIIRVGGGGGDRGKGVGDTSGDRKKPLPSGS